ncbi:unannotated protein [freshwater metagenome]|uniref:Unannotated protein n=1 Tax=freshwater metagenome TaxID=449393 RepID=A0A6J6HSM2_9ZZZZ
MPTFVGMQRSWWFAQIMQPTESVDTFPHLLVLQVCTKLVSIISFGAKTTMQPATTCISKAMDRQAFMRAHFSKADLTKTTSIISAAKLEGTAKGFLVTRTRDSCLSSGNFPPYPWGSDQSPRCIRHVLIAICTIVESTTPHKAECGHSLVMVKQMNQKHWDLYL